MLLLLLLAAGGGAVLYAGGRLTHGAPSPPPQQITAKDMAPAVTVHRVVRATLVETVLVTGTLVPRNEVLVAPEVEGLRVLELHAEEGDRVAKGDLLARLEDETLKAELAQNDATLARAKAAIARARSEIVSAEAREHEATSALERAKPLQKSGYLADSVFDQREAAARTAAAQLVAARDGLALAEAEKAQTEAQRRQIAWRLDKTEIRAPAAGLISRRNARIGGLASGAADPMFRIIADGEIELDAEVPETELAKLKIGQKALITIAGVGEVEGKVRLVSPEVDRTTRLGRVRIFLGDDPGLRIGSFGRGSVVTARSDGLVVPASAVRFAPDGPEVQLVEDGRIVTRSLTTGLRSGGLIEVTSGLAEGDVVVAKAGTFLRDGDAVRPVPAPSRGPRLSEIN
ncbi:MAG TPA: efflux RND transporter periplasmic adaptor subunit [Hyphomicrobiaceae bacterium]|nr:efflux RND transporter periplasmic adaptor subunit [Hyphomicrobiaceae bacterium]